METKREHFDVDTPGTGGDNTCNVGACTTHDTGNSGTTGAAEATCYPLSPPKPWIPSRYVTTEEKLDAAARADHLGPNTKTVYAVKESGTLAAHHTVLITRVRYKGWVKNTACDAEYAVLTPFPEVEVH